MKNADQLIVAIEKDIIPFIGGGCISYRYEDAATGRIFTIHKEADGFSLHENIPNGQIIVFSDDGGVERLIKSEELMMIEKKSPNAFIREAEGLGIPKSRIVFCEFTPDTKVLPSLRTCARTIHFSIANDERYQETCATNTAADDAKEEISRLHARLGTAKSVTGGGIFSGCHDLSGKFGKKEKDIILSYLNAPDDDTWISAKNIVIAGETTIGQAIAALGTKPSPDNVRIAIKDAVAKNIFDLENKIADLSSCKGCVPTPFPKSWGDFMKEFGKQV